MGDMSRVMKKKKEQNKEKEMQDFCRAVQEFREARRNASKSDESKTSDVDDLEGVREEI